MPRIIISAHQSFHFEQFVEISKEKLEELKNATERKLRDGDSSPILDHLDLTDPSGFGDFDDVSIIEVDADGNPIEDGIEIWA